MDEHRIAFRSRARPARTESARSVAALDEISDIEAGRARLRRMSCWPAPITTRTARTAGWRISDSTAQRSTGLPPSSRYCLGTSPPMRAPLPAATMSAVVVIGARV